MGTNGKRDNVLVTGSCGFIGHHLVRELKRRGYRVTGLDDLSNGDKKYAHEADDFMCAKVSYVTPALLRKFKYVFHLAALPRVPYSIEYPWLTHDANVNETLHLLIAAVYGARNGDLKKVVYSSSSSVYGAQTTFPSREDLPTVPISPYAAQKLAGENYAEVFRKVYGLPTASLRYFNVYGEEQKADNPYTGVITRFLDLKEQGKPLTVYGSGEQKRDFTYVGDVVEANILAAEQGEGVYNVGTGTNHSIVDIAGAIGGDITFGPAREGDPPLSLADNSRLRALGWEPKTELLTWLKKKSSK